ncbi:hypothetical protein [Actibacterium ureilyticum]|uniref:hypothetical protein n=1 Tax=Actibacterium ureilyticum TaxID=1590614 RepID=UPI000BAAF6B0|nr:hypothetical protein [Actibacterium ureilyticum]
MRFEAPNGEYWEPKLKDGAFWVQVPVESEALLRWMILQGYSVRCEKNSGGDFNLKKLQGLKETP